MDNLFIGKFKQGDQLEKNYYRIDNEDEAFKQTHTGGLEIGDYVLPIQAAAIKKLFRFTGFKTVNGGSEAKFDVVKTFSPSLAFSSICFCKYIQPDIVLMNKAAKSTRGVGFHKLLLEADCPDIADIDFQRDKRRFFVCLQDKISDRTLFRPSDICIVISDIQKSKIVDIMEFNGQTFRRHETFWKLYQDKLKESGAEYSLSELLEFADPQHDSAKLKEGYLRSILSALEAESIFSVDNIVSLYDNVIVGRRRTPKKASDKAGHTPSIADISEDEDEIEYEDLTAYQQYARLMEFNPNIILYGPPGTGKTYGAMRIIEAFERQIGSEAIFKKVITEDRAKFITFHQAFSYEEFVEGIRPKVDDDGNISYPVEPGILREIADACRIQGKKKDVKDEALSNTTPSSRVWKVSLGRRNQDEHIYKTLRDKAVIAVGYGRDEDVSSWDDALIDESDSTGTLKYLHSKVEIGDIVLVFNSIRTIRLIGVVIGDYFYTDEDSFGYRHRRKVKWLMNCENNPIDIFNLNHGKQLTLSSLYELKIPVSDAVSLIVAKEDKTVTAKPYYLIIDEINRGNIAKIFGELITLIEKDKREVLSCTLPYSRISFTLPKNLYIVGTMNTSDRSIALLDTALRRRFAFVEINPDTSLVEQKHPTIGGSVSPSKLLQELNNRITKKIDRDHRIGHSYFLEDDLVTKYDLYNVWYYKIFPLLMEYFYNDVKQVGEIIGKQFFDEAKGEIIPLSLKSNENGVSDFENALMKIYERRE